MASGGGAAPATPRSFPRLLKPMPVDVRHGDELQNVACRDTGISGVCHGITMARCPEPRAGTLHAPRGSPAAGKEFIFRRVAPRLGLSTCALV
ncbi:hypothetical protein FKM82_029403 [Ascaphus truei]